MTRTAMRRFLHRLAPAVASALLALPSLAAGPDVRAKLLAPPGLAPATKGTLTVELTLGPSWHVNSHTPSEDFLIPTTVKLTSTAGTLSPVTYPKHVEKRFSFSEKPLAVYEGTVKFTSELSLPAGASGKVTLGGEVTYQACNDKQCFPPETVKLEGGFTVSSLHPTAR